MFKAINVKSMKKIPMKSKPTPMMGGQPTDFLGNIPESTSQVIEKAIVPAKRVTKKRRVTVSPQMIQAIKKSKKGKLNPGLAKYLALKKKK